MPSTNLASNKHTTIQNMPPIHKPSGDKTGQTITLLPTTTAHASVTEKKGCLQFSLGFNFVAKKQQENSINATPTPSAHTHVDARSV